MKKILIIFVALLVITGCDNKDAIDNSNVNIDALPDVKGNENVKVDSTGDKTNISKAFSTEKKYENYVITDGKLKTDKNGMTYFTAVVKNNSSETINGGLVDIIFIDSKNNKVSKLSTYIRVLNSGETMDMVATIEKDLSNAYDYYFEKHS